MANICRFCGAQLDEEALECKACGNAVYYNYGTEPTLEYEQQLVQKDKKNKKKKKKKGIKAIIAVILVLALAVGAHFGFSFLFGYRATVIKTMDAIRTCDGDIMLSVMSDSYVSKKNEDYSYSDAEDKMEEDLSKILEDFEERVGKDIYLTYKIIYASDLTEREFETGKSRLKSRGYNVRKIDRIKEVEVDATLSGDEGEALVELDLILSKEDGEWKVLDYIIYPEND